MSEKVYKWHWDCGRQGDLEGLFVATEEDVAAAVGKEAYFGEVLGKHSEVYGTLEEKEFTVLTDEAAVIAFVKEHGPFGWNPLGYVRILCDDCGSHMAVEEEEQDYWCHDCEERLCYDCGKSDRHQECRDIVHYDKRSEVPA